MPFQTVLFDITNSVNVTGNTHSAFLYRGASLSLILFKFQLYGDTCCAASHVHMHVCMTSKPAHSSIPNITVFT